MPGTDTEGIIIDLILGKKASRGAFVIRCASQSGGTCQTASVAWSATLQNLSHETLLTHQELKHSMNLAMQCILSCRYGISASSGTRGADYVEVPSHVFEYFAGRKRASFFEAPLSNWEGYRLHSEKTEAPSVLSRLWIATTDCIRPSILSFIVPK